MGASSSLFLCDSTVADTISGAFEEVTLQPTRRRTARRKTTMIDAICEHIIDLAEDVNRLKVPSPPEKVNNTRLPASDQAKLDEFWQYCLQNQYFNVGYPESADFDYSELDRFMRFSINNCGDWAASESCNYKLHSFDFERDVIEHFAGLFKLPFQECWGYVTNGGTEGNMFGCYLARELFPEGILYHSRASHYSVAKLVKMLRIKARVVETGPKGEMLYDDLLAKIAADNCRNPIIFANVGTTMMGAIDDVVQIQSLLNRAGFVRGDYYIHADAALSGMILPFVDEPQAFSFADGIDSISVSGHKMIGTPFPCGVVLAKKRYVDAVSVDIEYISAPDKTITGSRSGHGPLMLWYAIKGSSEHDQRIRIERCQRMAQYVVDSMQATGVDAWRHANSITVVFPSPSEATWRKHGLATSEGNSHLITCAHHLDTKHLDVVIADVVADLVSSVQAPC